MVVYFKDKSQITEISRILQIFSPQRNLYRPGVRHGYFETTLWIWPDHRNPWRKKNHYCICELLSGRKQLTHNN